jgi:hypothetical protein
MNSLLEARPAVNGHVPEPKPARPKKRRQGKARPVTPKPRLAPKPDRKPSPRPTVPMPPPRKPAAHQAPEAGRPDHLTRYAYSGVALMAVLSALLNGHANSLGATIPWAGWAMGLVIPAIILLLAKVAGLLYKRGPGFRRLAYLTGGTGTGLLLLSVWHCATSISLLTGSPLLLALPMAVAIDVGFVCCEVAALVE